MIDGQGTDQPRQVAIRLRPVWRGIRGEQERERNAGKWSVGNHGDGLQRRKRVLHPAEQMLIEFARRGSVECRNASFCIEGYAPANRTNEARQLLAADRQDLVLRATASHKHCERRRVAQRGENDQSIPGP